MRKAMEKQRRTVKSCEDLEVYQLAYQLAMEIFHLTKRFPKEELYSLTGQIRDSSRSVASNIREGWGKRRYENLFKRHLVDAMGSEEETKTWLDFSRDCGYITDQEHKGLMSRYDSVGRMLNRLFDAWQAFGS